jgi:hypothetical protein
VGRKAALNGARFVLGAAGGIQEPQRGSQALVAVNVEVRAGYVLDISLSFGKELHMPTKAIVIATTFALTTALTSAAPAQASSRDQTYDRPAGTYAHHVRRHHSAYRSRSVYNIRGRYRGSDPDPFIRSQLGRCREC